MRFPMTIYRLPERLSKKRSWFKNPRFRVTLGISAPTLIGPALERVWANPSLPCGVLSSAQTGCIPEVPASERAAHRLTAPQDSSRLDRNLRWVAPFVRSPQALQHRARIGLFGDWLDTFRVPVLRFSTLGPARHPGAFPVQAPDRTPETWTWSPGSEGGRQLARPQPRRQPDRLQAGQG